MRSATPTFKQRLARNELLLGGWVTFPHPGVAEIMARAGFDFVVIDLEHSVLTIGEAGELIRVIDLCGVVPLVRLTSNDANQIKRVMDAGAHGIVVPMVNSKSDAQRAVRAVSYPTRGDRGVGLGRAHGYGAKFTEYCDWLDQNAVVIVQIEHIDAVNSLEEILSVEEVDAYIIGPYDLSASLKLPGQFGHPDVVEAMARVERVAKVIGKPGGVHVIEADPAQLKAGIQQGFTFIAYSVDFRIIDRACREAVGTVRQQ